MKAADESAASLAYLQARLTLLEARIRCLVDERRLSLEPSDPLRGLYLTDEQVDRLLWLEPRVLSTTDFALEESEVDRADKKASATGSEPSLSRLARLFDLEPLDIDLLLVAAAPDFDPRFELLYGYLHDDLTRRRPSIGLALELCGIPHMSVRGRSRFHRRSPLRRWAILGIDEPQWPLLSRPLRVPDRVTGFLLDDDDPDAAITHLLVPAPLVPPMPSDLARAIEAGARLGYVRQRPGSDGAAFALSALKGVGREVLMVDLARLESSDDVASVASKVGREARLRDEVVVAGPLDALLEHGTNAVRYFINEQPLVVLVGAPEWRPEWSGAVPFVTEAPLATASEQLHQWHSELDGSSPDTAVLVAATQGLRLTAPQVARAAEAARLGAAAASRRVTEADVRAGARAQNAAGLSRLARRIEPVATWEDLVLPDDRLGQLHDLTARVRLRELVLEKWQMGGGPGRGRGVTALFAGPSGTGKTLAAEVIAADLGLDLYTIDLSTIVDKYIGETEKNLDRAFDEAERVNGVIFFDEADALFGKRSAVQDARDRYANIEVAYLLQRMEAFDGFAVLATNLRSNIDEAFARRLDAVVDFPVPDAAARQRLWDLCLRPGVPRSDDLDFATLANQFELAGGGIRNVTVAAAYVAAATGTSVDMGSLRIATEAEYRKLGRLPVVATQ